MRALRKVAGLPGVPADAFRIDAHALAYRYIPGTPARQSRRGAQERRSSSPHSSACSREVHARGIVHLDVRNGRNVLITESGRPALIDFQSHLGTAHLPGALRRWMERFDMAGRVQALGAPSSAIAGRDSYRAAREHEPVAAAVALPRLPRRAQFRPRAHDEPRHRSRDLQPPRPARRVGRNPAYWWGSRSRPRSFG